MVTKRLIFPLRNRSISLGSIRPSEGPERVKLELGFFMSRKIDRGWDRKWIINFLNGDGFLSFPNLWQYYLTQMCTDFLNYEILFCTSKTIPNSFPDSWRVRNSLVSLYCEQRLSSFAVGMNLSPVSTWGKWLASACRLGIGEMYQDGMEGLNEVSKWTFLSLSSMSVLVIWNRLFPYLCEQRHQLTTGLGWQNKLEVECRKGLLLRFQINEIF